MLALRITDLFSELPLKNNKIQIARPLNIKLSSRELQSMKSSGYWNMEDAFFGAILGVVLGDLWKNLSLEYIFIIIAFFVLFPMTLRRSEKQLGKTGILAAMLVGILWVVLLIIFLDSKSIVLLEEGGLRFMVVFLGWQVSRLTSILTSIG